MSEVYKKGTEMMGSRLVYFGFSKPQQHQKDIQSCGSCFAKNDFECGITVKHILQIMHCSALFVM